MSIFEEIFGKSPESGTAQDLERAEPQIYIDPKLIAQGRFLLMYEGKLYQITAEEVDLSSIKIKPKVSTSTRDSAGDQKKEQS